MFFGRKYLDFSGLLKIVRRRGRILIITRGPLLLANPDNLEQLFQGRRSAFITSLIIIHDNSSIFLPVQ